MKEEAPALLLGELTLETLKRVRRRVGLSRSSIYRLIAIGKFPRPAKLSERAIAWDSREIDAWIQARINARDATSDAAIETKHSIVPRPLPNTQRVRTLKRRRNRRNISIGGEK